MTDSERRGTVLVLGAGATLGGGFLIQRNNKSFRPPLDRDFFQATAVQTVFKKDDFPALFHYQRHQSLETTWSTVDLYHKLCRTEIINEETADHQLAEAMRRKANGSQPYRMKLEREDRRWRVPSMAGWELLELISKVFQDLALPKQQESPLLESPLLLLVNRLMEPEQSLTGAISFNYDTSLEQLCPERFYYPLFESENAVEKLPLFKLHGSLNWQTDTRLNPPVTGTATKTTVATMAHGNGWYRQPEIVGPTFFKQEITFDLQQDPRAQYYRRLWGLAWNMLRSARHLVFVGFSFPNTDFHAAALFRTANLSGAGFWRVIFCHYNDAQLCGTFKGVFDGRTVKRNEFKDGLKGMTDRLDEVVALLQS